MNDVRPHALAHLRVAPRDLFQRYLQAHGETLAFFAAIRGRPWQPPRLEGSHVVMHAWREGTLCVDAAQASILRRAASGDHEPLPPELEERMHAMGWLADEPPDLDGLVEKVKSTFPAIQNPWELRRFLDEVERRKPEVIVEIGSAAGGTLYCWLQLARSGGIVVGIDAPHAIGGEPEHDWMGDLFAALAPRSIELVRIRDRSFHHSTRQDLLRALGNRKIDLLLIDGDHSYGAIHADVEMYRPLVGSGGLIAMHDICMHPARWGRGHDVAIYWQELCERLVTKEIIDPEGSLDEPSFDDPSRFVMPALGFGLIEVD
ncbi:MAG: class I SAM-dependent methyltransferase [Myxococcales bacterium]|nr:class I SAM-dependent methyltransferase [Myxococcales bacterium]